MLGPNSKYAGECIKGNYIGAGWFEEDLTGEFSKGLPDFKKVYVPKLKISKGAASRACRSLYRICKEMQEGDIVLSPDGKGNYKLAKIKDDYRYVKGANFPHRRGVEWLDGGVSKDKLPEALRRLLGSRGTVINLEDHDQEIEQLISNPSDFTIEDRSAFVTEDEFEAFLIQNWEETELSKDWDLYTDEEGEIVAKQFQTDTGPMDILAISKDKKEFLVVELKKGRASASVVAQILSYMDYIRQEVAKEEQEVKGCIIAFEDDLRIRRALQNDPRIDFYRYGIKLKLSLEKV